MSSASGDPRRPHRPLPGVPVAEDAATAAVPAPASAPASSSTATATAATASGPATDEKSLSSSAASSRSAPGDQPASAPSIAADPTNAVAPPRRSGSTRRRAVSTSRKKVSKRRSMTQTSLRVDKELFSDPARPSILRITVADLIGYGDHDRTIKLKLRKRELLRKLRAHADPQTLEPCEFVINLHTHSFDHLKPSFLISVLSDDRKFAFAPEEDGSGAVCTIILDFEYHPIVLAGEEDLVAEGGGAPDARQVFLEAGAMNKLSEALEPSPSKFRPPGLSSRKSQPTLKAAATAALAASRMAQMAQNPSSPRKSMSGDPSSPATAVAANGNSSPAASSRDVSAASSPDAPDAQQTQPPPSVARSIIRALTLGPREPSNDRRGNSSAGGGGGLRLRTALGGKARGAPTDDASAGSPRGAAAWRTPPLSPRYDTPPAGSVDGGDAASASGSTAAASTSASLGYVTSMESERFRLLPARLTAPLGEVDVLIHAALKHGSDIKRGRRIKAMKLLMRWENVAAATAGRAPLAASASAAAAAAAAGGDIVRDLEVVETAKRLNDH
ncbi:hypothetical protein HK405_010740, partial [Cladochytrium tenue]